MKSLYCFVSAIVVVTTANAAQAEFLSVTSSQLAPRSETNWFDVTLRLEGSQSEEAMLAWQLLLEIVPTSSGATGLYFAGFGQPENYVFADSVGICAGEISTPTSLFVSDIANTPVLVTGGAGLLRVVLDASSAQGAFEIRVVPGTDIGSAWLSDQWNVYELSMVPAIAFPTPEPSSWILAILAIVYFAGSAARRRLKLSK